MKRTAITLLIVIGLIVLNGKTAQAGPATAIANGVAAQTLAISYHPGAHGHHGYRGNYGYYGPRPYYGHRPPVIYAPPRPVVVEPYIYYSDPYMMQRGSFYYSGRGFSFGFGY